MLAKATLRQLPGGWWRAQELGGFERGAVAETAFEAWSQLQAFAPMVPADEETRLWAVDGKWAAQMSDRPEIGGTMIVTRMRRESAELRAFGRVL